MTATSVEFFPCRVQLMGLPRSNLAAESTLINLDDSSRPPFAKIQRISRNLFGSPDPVEMKNFYRKETERQRLHILQKYNFDTHASKLTNEEEKQPADKSQSKQSTNNPAKQPTQFSTLIEQELRQHEQRLENEKQSLSRAYLETTPCYEKNPSEGKNTNYSASPYITSERQKPYARQSLLTENFNIRKNKGCGTTNGKPCNSEIITLENNKNRHCNFETFQLPQHTNSIQKSCDLTDKSNKQPTNKKVNNQEGDEIDTNGITMSYNDSCTKFSLQLVISTKNVS